MLRASEKFMPRTIDHIVETYRIAQARRKAGLPAWAHQIDVSDIFHNEALTFEQRRDRIVARLQASAWCRNSEAVQELTDELADSENGDEFDGPWDDLYDEADYDRVWIKTV
jgi:hypothetical protein